MTGFDHQAAGAAVVAAAAAVVDVVISHCFLCVHTCATSVKVRERERARERGRKPLGRLLKSTIRTSAPTYKLIKISATP